MEEIEDKFLVGLGCVEKSSVQIGCKVIAATGPSKERLLDQEGRTEGEVGGSYYASREVWSGRI
jgi:hypothetical protein